MNRENLINIAFALTGSFCTIREILPQMKKIAGSNANVIPIMSEAVYCTDTRFFAAEELRNEIKAITGNEIIHTIVGAEPIGPKMLADLMVIAPCTGNTLNKIANGINDTAVTMAAKSALRNEIPVVISVSTNDGLSSSAMSIGALLNRKHIYFVPFRQDDPIIKSRSTIADSSLIIPAMKEALNGRQLQPILM